jgi:Pyruvate/2-oxoglutarate dehydrogenase complex, dehydrogenase (E1) component, eukaryotic type, alpha subunit
VQLITPDGRFAPTEAAAEYLPYLDRLSDADHARFYRDMIVVRRFDTEATNLQRQGQLALWPPSRGQEAAQVGSAHAARPQDHIFPSYREHVVGMIRGIDPIDIIRVMRGVTNGGWDPTDPKNGNFHVYTLVLGTQALHATGYALGMTLDGTVGTGDPQRDSAVMVYFGDGASSEGDVSEAFVFAASYQTPQVFFLQNNQWAISVPVSTQSRNPLYLRSSGFGIPGVQVDGNDVLASYAVSAKHLDDARSGHGPSLIEAVTYRVGAHTTSDDPTRYRGDDEEAYWADRDPIRRFRAYLQGRGAPSSVFEDAEREADDLASDVRRRTLELRAPVLETIFDHVYSEEHPLIAEQRAWLQRYEQSLEASESGGGATEDAR